MDQITQVGCVAYTYLTTKLDLQTNTQQLLAYVPLTKVDPGLVYISFMKSCGITLSGTLLNYAQYLRQETLSAAQYRAHRSRIDHLNRMELRRNHFEHYVKPESADSTEVALAKRTPWNSRASDERVETGACGTDTSSSEASTTGEAAGKVERLDGEEWLLIVSTEEPGEATEEALEEIDAHIGGIGMAM